ncbi:MAG TPA: ABC transporter permease [Fimbriimonadaceae bacterium]|nr:ABC transporter permease [Fimbriimonadaceae bacterium]HRE93524.1 ABC transporter permease [Fimbriimonadaceae bacterium]HRI73854.1 ABC transporter permease [Fimbriimonadaceae bacterium]
MALAAALTSLRENWRQSILSAVGVAIASIAILLLVSIGLGVQKDISSQVEDLGVNILIVVPARVELGGMNFNPNFGGQSFLTEADAQNLTTIAGVREAATLTFAGGGLKYGDKSAYPFTIATTPEWFAMHKAEIAEGAFFGPGTTTKDPIVLGSIAKETLFGDQDALGKMVRLSDKEFEVIGVLKDQGESESMFSMQSFANVAYIPYQDWKAKHPDAQIDRIMVQFDPATDPKVLVPALEKKLGERLDYQQYSVLTQEDLLGLIFKVMGVLGTLVVGLTSIALFVGGVGIMTVMLMSVNERRVEIGIRQACGATRRDIFRQFLIEAVLIGLAGSFAGLVVSALVNTVLASTTSIKPLMTWGTVALAFGVGVGVGAIFGAWPARRAANQDPVVSLRNL